MRIASVGHAVFAATLFCIGILGLVKGDFTSIWNGVPDGMPAREVLAYLCALVALVCGLGLFWRRTATLSSRVLLGYFVLWALVFKLHFIIMEPTVEGSWQSCGQNAVMVAGAWVLYAWFATDRDRRWIAFATGDSGVRIARVLYGLALLAFGLSHFFYLELTAPLVPGWLHGPVFWAYFTGCAYLAAGVAILAGVWARLAATLSALQMGGFLLLLWIPRAVAGRLSSFQWGELVATCALTAAAWVVADSYRKSPWFAAIRVWRKESASP